MAKKMRYLKLMERKFAKKAAQNHNKTGAIKAYIYHRNLGSLGWRRCLL